MNVTFYSEDVHRVWQKWTKQSLDRLRPGIEVTLDDAAQTATVGYEANTAKPSRIQAIDVGYDALKPHIEKARAKLATAHVCTICSSSLPADGMMTLVCPNAACGAVGHAVCFARSFSGNNENVVPTIGACPACGAKLRWVDLVKELSLRMRGEAEVEKMFKVRKSRATKKDAAAVGIAAAADDRSEDDDLDDEEMPDLSPSDESETEDAVPAKLSLAPIRGVGFASPRADPSADLYVDDSDWDEAELVT